MMLPDREEKKSNAYSMTTSFKHQLRLFFTALQFFTRIPIPRWVGFDPQWLHHASRYFALAGLVVAIGAAGVYFFAAMIFPHTLSILLSTATGIYLTGAFHEDGFADFCDGFGGGFSRDRVLEIMTDSRIGTYGAVGIGLLLAIKCLALAGLPPNTVLAALMVAHPLSRAAATTMILAMNYVKSEGKAKPLAQRMSILEFSIGLSTAVVVTIGAGISGFISWLALATGTITLMLSTLWIARLCQRRIGGYTGDCLGAVQQIAEAAFYLGVLSTLRCTSI